MDCEVMEMDTRSDSPHCSEDDGPSQIPETPSQSPEGFEDLNSVVKKSSSPRCNFNVVIDIEDDSETGEESQLQEDDIKENSDQSQFETVGSDTILRGEEGALNSEHNDNDSDTDFEEPVEDVEFPNHSVTAENFEISNESQCQPIYDEVDQIKDPYNKRNIFRNENICAKKAGVSLLEKKVQERKLLEQEMMNLEPIRNAQFTKLKKFSPEDKIFPSVRPSNFHTVGFLMTNDYKPGDALKPFPVSFVSKWHPEFVPMPCCRQNVKVVKIRVASAVEQNEDNSKTYEERVYVIWEHIEDALSRPLLTCRDIQLSIKQYCGATREFSALNYCLESIMTNSERDNFFTKVLPVMQTLCLDLKTIVTCPLPLLCRFMNHSISLTQKQIASLLANAFFSTFPKRLEDDLMFPTINFNELFVEDPADNDRLIVKANKIRCLLHYFERIVEDMPKGVVTYTRKSIRNSKAPDWKNSTKKLTNMLALMDGTIETDGAGLLGVDFANKIIGGGVLGRGAVQEEILFVIYPELLLTRLFTEKLTACEAVIVTGCERFCHYSGYANNFEYGGSFYDCTPWDPKGRRCTQFVAIDALYITKPMSQFHPRLLKRELDKAYVGFSSPNGSTIAVATGKWGCGAFNGDPQLKSILQLLAASLAGRDIVLFTFGDLYLLRDLENMYSIIKGMTIGEVWNLLEKYYNLFGSSKQTPSLTLAEFLADYAAGGMLGSMTDDFNSSENAQKKIEPSTSKGLKEIPVRRFYANKSSPKDTDLEKKKANSFAVSPGVNNVTSRNPVSNEPSLMDKLEAMESLKASFASNLRNNETVINKKDGCHNSSLSEDQISSMLKEDELMDVGDEEESKAVKRCKSSDTSRITSPKSGKKMPSAIRIGKSASSPSSIGAVCSTSPKPKKQMTLHDFFG